MRSHDPAIDGTTDPFFRPRPTVSQLWRGCILYTIGQALQSALTGTGGIGGWFSWWEDHRYLLDDGSGDLGALVFGDRQVAGIFFGHESDRSPWSQGHDVHDVDWYFRGMPPHLRAWADREIVPYTMRWGSPGDPPLITAAFWGEQDQIAAAEPWPDLYWNGAKILHTELQEPERAIRTIESNLPLPPAYDQLLRSLYKRKVRAGNRTITISTEERQRLIESRPPDVLGFPGRRLTGGADDDGLTLCREMLAPIGIVIP